MTIASDLLQRHIQTLVANPDRTRHFVGTRVCASPCHPARLSGRAEVVRFVTWFLETVQNFRLIDPKVYAFAYPRGAGEPSLQELTRRTCVVK